MSETAKYRHLVTKYCHGCGVDVGSQGDSVVPWAIGIDLPEDSRVNYSVDPFAGPVQLRCFGEKLPLETNSLNFVYSSHLLEDFEDWNPVLSEWVRVLRPRGYLIVILPDKELWKAALDRGQTPNNNHKHEAIVGELSAWANAAGLGVIEDRRTNLTPEDYSILFVAKKLI